MDAGGATVKETAMRRIWMAALAASVASVSPASGAEPGMAARLAGPTILGSGTTIVPVRLNGGQWARRGARAELVIEGLAFDAPPGALYEVSLRAPNGRRAPVGLINFYNRTAPGYGRAGAAPGRGYGEAGPASPDGRRIFDATEALRSLGGLADALVFEPTAGVTGPGVRIHTDPAARVRFASASIRWR
jgi:hypothetical protein